MSGGEARLVFDEPEQVYRAAEGNNYSALKYVLDCPARYLYETTHRKERKEFDLGHLVHGIILGTGTEPCVIDAPSWQRKAVQEERDAARERGEVPCLTHQWEQVQECAASVMAHPQTGPWFRAPQGRSEVSAYWTDEVTGLPCKARIDRLVIAPNGLHYLIDLKTVGRTSDPRRFGRHAADYDYHMQAAFYRDGYAAAVGVDPDDIVWLNAVVEVDPPFLSSLVELDAPSVGAGRRRYRRALHTIAECRETGQWPGYTQDEAALVSIPKYLLDIEEDLTTNDKENESA